METQEVTEQMQKIKQAHLDEVKSACWNGTPSEEIAAFAVDHGVPVEDVQRISKEVATIRESVEAANAIDLPALEKALAEAKAKVAVAAAALEKAQDDYREVAYPADAAETAVITAKQTLFHVQSLFRDGIVPASIKPSKSIKAAMAGDAERMANDSKRIELMAKHRKLNSRINELRTALEGRGGEFLRTFAIDKKYKSMEDEITALTKERQQVQADLDKLG
jgi:hypothetical protein